MCIAVLSLICTNPSQSQSIAFLKARGAGITTAKEASPTIFSERSTTLVLSAGQMTDGGRAACYCDTAHRLPAGITEETKAKIEGLDAVPDGTVPEGNRLRDLPLWGGLCKGRMCL